MFKHLAATGVQILRGGACDYESWSFLMLHEFGPSVRPLLAALRARSVAEWTGARGRLNCWEFMGCGREAGIEGACPAAGALALDGVHGGLNGGRLCWAVAGTLCAGRPEGPEEKSRACRSCDFYRVVLREEGMDFIRAHLL